MNQRTIPIDQRRTIEKIALGLNLTEEMEGGRIMVSEIKPFNLIPLITIDKDTGKEVTDQTKRVRVCRHGSSRTFWGYCMNELTPPQNYKTILPLTKTWCFMVIDGGRWCLFYKSDLKDAFRQLGVNKYLWIYEGYAFLKKWLIDTRDIYGTKAASKHTQDLGEMLTAAFLKWIQQFLKPGEYIAHRVYIDDHAGCIKSDCFSDRKRETFLMNKFYEFLALCGIKESIKKRRGLSWVMILCGLLYKSSDMTVGPGADKKYTVIFTLICIYQSGTCMSKDYESLIGSLRWFAALIWPGTAFLRRMTMKLTAHKRIHGEDNVLMEFNEEDQKDHHWWIIYSFKLDRISVYDVVAPKPTTMIPLWSDGATNGSREKGWCPGIGAYYRGHWMLAEVPSQFLDKYENETLNYSKETQIAHFEALAIVAAINSFEPFIESNICIHLKCDNQVCEGIFANKNSDDLFIMDCVRWLVMFAVDHRIRFYISYCLTLENISDPLSRFDIPKFIKIGRQRRISVDGKPTKCKIPDLNQF